jgi:hypothetical protein
MVRTCLAAVAVALVLAPVAQAADVRVVNQRGIPQLALWSDDGGTPRFLTDADGYIRDVDPQATLRVTRSTLDPAQYPCFKNTGGAPEGPGGVSLKVSETGGTITLPNATGPSYQPDSNEAERWIVGKINELRAQRGAPPVRVAATLNRVADAVARRQFTESLSFPPPFCPVVVVDWGFPAFGYASVDAGGTDPRKAWAHWSDGSVRETAVTNPEWNAVGVGDGGGAWTAYLAKCPVGREARCEMSADEGDPSIQLPPPQTGPQPGPGGGGGDYTLPVLAVSAKRPKAVKAGRPATVKATVGNTGDAAASGVRVCLTVPKPLKPKLQCKGVGGLAAGASSAPVRFKVRTKKNKPGRYTLALRAAGTGVDPATATTRLKVKK